MVRDLMLKELILPDCKRAFTIVEAQLALLRDYFFLAYQINWLSMNICSQRSGIRLFRLLNEQAASAITFLRRRIPGSGGLLGRKKSASIQTTMLSS
uniref:Uncharacterized protein n=1 Tax=Setaria viridis TaxID=4556 RepID=A0A4U6VNW7_SETVI|nr:hypothetical protein SEVIR_2G062000v2 [Setaria viridis]TKW30805.1 hypothetical protein SEVIR_2G062000v2 [Setaria viridis]